MKMARAYLRKELKNTTMKNYSFLPVTIKNICLLSAFFLFIPATESSGRDNDPAKTLAIFVNGHQLPTWRDSIEVTAKGSLTLSTLTPEYTQSEKAKFRVVIRSTIYTDNMPLIVFDKRFEDGKEFETIDLETLLLKTKAGDSILIIPVDENSKFENSKEPFVVHLVADKC